MVKVGASILDADFSILGEEIRRLEKAGIDFISFDIMDGHFVENITFGPDLIKSLRDKTKLPFEAHLMVYSPEKYIEKLVYAGVDIINIHAESCKKMEEAIKSVKADGKQVGIALNPKTPPESIGKFLGKIDMVLVMAVEPGFSGQKFIDMTGKIKYLRGLEKEFDICVDGGINEATAKQVADAGATAVISSSYIFSHEDYSEAIRKLKISK